MENILITIKRISKPSLILVHPTIVNNKEVLDIITDNLDRDSSKSYKYICLKSSCWHYETSVQTLTSKVIIQSSGNHSKLVVTAQDNYRVISSQIDLNNRPALMATGALLFYMQQHVFHMDRGHIKVSNITDFPLESYVAIDSCSLEALQIFCVESHPNLIKSSGKSKEGYSIFGLFDRTKSMPGRRRLRYISTSYLVQF